MRLSLLPNLRQLWRDSRTVQLGTNPTRAIVLEFSDPIAARVLDLLDGSRTEDQVLADAGSVLAIDPPDTLRVLHALRAAGLLVDAHALLPIGLPEPARVRLLPEAAALALASAAGGGLAAAHADGPPERIPRAAARGPGTPAEALHRRAEAKILVVGSETLAAPVALALAGAGIGHVDPAIDGRGRPGDLLAAIARTAPDTQVCPIRAGYANVIVRIGSRPCAVTGRRWKRAAVLSVGIRDGVVLIGPLVRPAGSPCEQCLELHRSDRDPAWPVLAAQLATLPHGPETCALTTTIAAAAYTAEEVLSYVDGRPVQTDGAAVEIARPGEARRRSWSAHPQCDCTRRQAETPGPETPGEVVAGIPDCRQQQVEMNHDGDPEKRGGPNGQAGGPTARVRGASRTWTGQASDRRRR
ncbi:MAG: PqqD family protein [Dactylosporangium sp.]|nr:PqqD family protein [Dactylosporangium sp.]